MAIGIEEIDRLENPVMGRAEHLEPFGLGIGLGCHQIVERIHLKGNMLDPGRCVLVAVHLLLLGQLEKGEDIAAARVEEDMHIGIIFAGRRHFILGKGELEFHAHHLFVEIDRLFCILAAIGDMVDAVDLWCGHQTGSFTFSTPRATWSRSMLSNRALKLPSPNPSSPLR